MYRPIIACWLGCVPVRFLDHVAHSQQPGGSSASCVQSSSQKPRSLFSTTSELQIDEPVCSRPLRPSDARHPESTTSSARSKRLIAHQPLRLQHGVPQPQRLCLPHVGNLPATRRCAQSSAAPVDLPFISSIASRSGERSKWSSIAVLPRPAENDFVTTHATASSTPY